MLLSIFDVAKYFIQKSKPGTDRAVTHLKLQKLLYYTQAWYYTLKSEPLFREKFEAWIHGPVCSEVFTHYRSYGFDVIKPAVLQKEIIIPNKVKNVIEEVWQVYGGLTGGELESLTHNEDPWKIARGNLENNSRSNNTISLESMKIYYSKVMKVK